MKRILLLTAMLMATMATMAQTLFELSYYDPDDNENYKGLLFYTDDDNCFLRCVGKADRQGNISYWEHKYVCGYEKEDGVNYMEFFPEESNNDEAVYPTFVMAYSASGEFDSETYVILDDLSQEDVEMTDDNTVTAKYFREVSLTEKDEDYFLQFYDEDEAMYKKIMRARRLLLQQNNSQASHNAGGNTSGNPSSSTTTTIPDNNGQVTMHFIVAAATQDKTIGQSVATDLKLVQKDFSAMAQQMGIGYKETLIQGSQFSKQSLEKCINGLNPGSNDVVVFVYSGHGFRFDDDTDAYPRMYLTYGDELDINKEMSTTELFKKITAKNARLTIFLSDCCNSEYGATRAEIEGAAFATRAKGSNTDIDKLKSLFINEKGTVRATAAKAGQYALCDASGGYLITSVLNNIRAQVNALTTGTPSWSTIIENASNYVSKKTSNQYDEAGRPVPPQEVVKNISIRK